MRNDGAVMHAAEGAAAQRFSEEVDVVVVGSGAAALSAALAAAVAGAGVLVLEKSDKLGGTSAMSGAGTWIPANHHARAAGLEDSPAEALEYLRATAPEGWAADEDELWRAFTDNAPRVLEFLETHTPLRFELTREPDPMAEYPGGKARGRMLSPRPLSRRLVGPYAGRIRRSTLPNIFSYREVIDYGAYHSPVKATLRLLPELVRRFLTDTRGQGNALVVGLLRGCLNHGCRVEPGCRVVALTQDETGGVNGVEMERGGARSRVRARRGVLLATGGFEWDSALRERWFKGPLDRIGSPRTNTGDGQHMAARAGAALARMDQANVYPTLPTRYEGVAHGMPMIFQAEPHAIVVDRNGRRFASEYDYNLGEALDRRDPRTGEPLHLPCWLVGDARFLRESGMFRWYAYKQRGWVKRAPTLAALAAVIGVPGEALARTVTRFNGFAAAGRDEDFHRGESAWERYKSGAPDAGVNNSMGTIERPPFIAVSLNRSILGTKGGPRTNARGQALRADGSIIAGLYCAGIAMANPIGTRAVGAGTTIGPCLTWGYICANNMLKDNR